MNRTYRTVVVCGAALFMLTMALPAQVWAQSTDFEIEVPAGTFQHFRFVCSQDDVLSGSFTATVGGVTNDINFYVLDSENYGKFSGYDSYTAALQYQLTGGRTWTYTIPYDDTWYVVYSNTYSWFTSKHVEGSHNHEAIAEIENQMAFGTVVAVVAGVGGVAAILIIVYAYRRRAAPVRIQEVILVICPHCGYKNDQVNRNCTNCGAQL